MTRVLAPSAHGRTVLMSSEFTLPGGSATLAAEREGSGPAVVCLHAGVCDRRMRRPLARLLAAAHHVVAYDRRGFGQSRCDDEPCSDLDDLCAVLDACAGAAPAILIGASLGGALAIDLALARHGAPAQSGTARGVRGGDPCVSGGSSRRELNAAS